MLDSNLYTGGLRPKEARDAEISLSVKKKSSLKIRKKNYEGQNIFN